MRALLLPSVLLLLIVAGAKPASAAESSVCRGCMFFFEIFDDALCDRGAEGTLANVVEDLCPLLAQDASQQVNLDWAADMLARDS